MKEPFGAKASVLEMDIEIARMLIASGCMRALKQSSDPLIEAALPLLERQLSSVFRSARFQLLRRLKEVGAGDIANIDGRTRNSIIKSVMSDAQAKYEAILTEAGITLADSVRREVVQTLGVDFTELSKEALTALENNALAASDIVITRVTDTILDNIRQSYADELSSLEVEDNIKEEFSQVLDNEIAQIAETELTSYANYTRQTTYRDYGVRYKKWVSMEDERVRDEHIVMHGQIVALDRPFTNGLMYPGDKSGPIESWIRCRCHLEDYYSEEELPYPFYE